MESRNGSPTAKRLRQLLPVLLMVAVAIPLVAQTAEPVSSRRAGRRVLVSIPDRKLAVIENDDVIATFDVAVGAASGPSPVGEFQIVTRVQNPTYYHTGKVIPAGKGNPVGTRWIGLSQKGYGIHGTDAPQSVGHAASHGCIRLRNQDAERLFSMVQVGDMVEIRGERDEEIAQIFGGEAAETTVAEAEVPVQEKAKPGLQQ